MEDLDYKRKQAYLAGQVGTEYTTDIPELRTAYMAGQMGLPLDPELWSIVNVVTGEKTPVNIRPFKRPMTMGMGGGGASITGMNPLGAMHTPSTEQLEKLLSKDPSEASGQEIGLAQVSAHLNLVLKHAKAFMLICQVERDKFDPNQVKNVAQLQKLAFILQTSLSEVQTAMNPLQREIVRLTYDQDQREQAQ